VYAYVSPWLSEVMSYGKAPWVPHMVKLAETDEDLREVIGGRWSEVGSRWADVVVPKDAIVFGRHGGDDSFDIPWVQEAVVETAKQRPEVWFLFLNTREFPGAASLPNIRFLPPTSDPGQKRKFLNSCDAMLHGRMRGETFGLSCLEFAMLGKPVLTYAGIAGAGAFGDSRGLGGALSKRRRAQKTDWRGQMGGRAEGAGGVKG